MPSTMIRPNVWLHRPEDLERRLTEVRSQMGDVGRFLERAGLWQLTDDERSLVVEYERLNFLLDD